MNKKIFFVAIMASFIMIGVSLVSAVNTQLQNEEKNLDKLDSPLFNIRTEKATKEKATLKIKNIITNFLENRIFLRLRIFNFKDRNIGEMTSKPSYDYICSDDGEENSQVTVLEFWCTFNPWCSTMKC